MGLELNSLAILPLIVAEHYPRRVEAVTKYFLIQALASGMIMFGTLAEA